MVTIATFSDIPKLERLINSVYRGEEGLKSWTSEAHLVGGLRVSQAYLRDLLVKPAAFLLTKLSGTGELMGCVYLEKQGRTCYLGLLSVDNTQQQRGLGRELLSEGEMFARENLQCEKIHMTVIHQRPELIAYYQRRGYKVTGETRPFAGDQVVGRALHDDLYFDVLEKDLSVR